MNIVNLFEYQSCIYESDFTTISVHETLEGAIKAMDKFLKKEYEDSAMDCLYTYTEWLDIETKSKGWRVRPILVES